MSEVTLYTLIAGSAAEERIPEGRLSTSRKKGVVRQVARVLRIVSLLLIAADAVKQDGLRV